MERKNSFRGIQSAISRMNPELLRSVITSATAAKGGPEARSPPGDASFRHAAAIPLPTLSFASRSDWEGTAPLTIFYNGTVAIFDLPREKAESILKMAEEGSVGGAGEPSDPTAALGHKENEAALLAKLNGGELLPIMRKRSLERFFAKRKERLTMSPYKRADCEVNISMVKETRTITAA